MRTALPSLAILFAALAPAPLSAQSNPQDFTLPPAPTPTPAPAPAAEGPVDDSGIVPVAPRPIATDTPAPAPTIPTPTTTAATPQPVETSRPVVQPIPTANRTPRTSPTRERAQPSREERGTAPQREETQRRTLPTPIAEQEAAIEERDVPEQAPTTDTSATAEALQGAAATDPVAQSGDTSPSATNGNAESESQATGPSIFEGLPSWLIWALLGGIALLAIGLFGWKRRKANAPAPSLAAAPPLADDPQPEADAEEVEPAAATTPVETPTTAPVAAPVKPAPAALAPTPPLAGVQPRLDLKLEVEQMSRSMMMVMLGCKLTLSNRSEKALRDILVTSDLISANKALPKDQQVASETAFLSEIGNIERIGPNKSDTVTATLKLPIAELSGFRQGDIPMFVPLIRLRVAAAGIDPIHQTYVAGVRNPQSPAGSSRLHPVPLNGMPGTIPNVHAKLLDESAE